MNKPKPPADFDDNPEWTEEDFARAKPAGEVHGAAAGALVRKRGRPVGSTNASRKEQIALRVDADVLEAYRASGPGWHVRMNAALRIGVRKYGVVQADGTAYVVERKLRKVTGHAMASYEGSTRVVGDGVSNSYDAYSIADQLNEERGDGPA